jgi:hypothetical protein
MLLSIVVTLSHLLSTTGELLAHATRGPGIVLSGSRY